MIVRFRRNKYKYCSLDSKCDFKTPVDNYRFCDDYHHLNDDSRQTTPDFPVSKLFPKQTKTYTHTNKEANRQTDTE